MTQPFARGVALVGCGSIGVSRHIPAWLDRPSGFSLVVVADPEPARREAGRVAAGLEPDDATGDIDKVLARRDVGVVDLCVPPSVRPAIVLKAARAGKHILSEKPLATSPAAGDAMLRACREASVVLGVVHNYLFFPEILGARSVIDSGAIGEVEVVILNYLGVRDDPGAPEYRPRWRHDAAASGGGVLMDLIHVVYLAERLLGRPIEAVSAFVTSRGAGGVEDLAICRFEARDAVALANVGWGVGPGGIDVSGTKGRIAIRYADGGTSPFVPLERVEVTDETGTREVEVPPAGGFLAPAIADFAESLVAGRRPAADGEAALHILEAAIAAYESAATGRTVTLPLDRRDPAYLRGVAGLVELATPAWTAVRRRQIFGIGSGPSGSSHAESEPAERPR